ncbi:DUF928 domain-containing protein [Leptolyngbya sp. NIES-2104]|uniref:DUF928 domain-containing protein n=1 Tax=Leptolyngbya sp. NIES-2104 TaxID=1552121 RepID=UPI0006EC4A54|nr:DUF928 domain-containing protein [Leptolyngbya sp. NIES-2104]GAP94306.1 hypothetical protein NIES2104_08170 [Leptolyngbya sp. NIES-2104]
MQIDWDLNPSRFDRAELGKLQTQLAAAQTPKQRIDLYAESGLWYDAISQARKSPQNQSAVLELLDSLASSEAQALREWRDRLIEIKKLEQQRQR